MDFSILLVLEEDIRGVSVFFKKKKKYRLIFTIYSSLKKYNFPSLVKYERCKKKNNKIKCLKAGLALIRVLVTLVAVVGHALLRN